MMQQSNLVEDPFSMHYCSTIPRILSCFIITSTILSFIAKSYGSATRSMSTTTFKKHGFTFDDISSFAKSIVPPLSHDDHKGSMGRVGVIGGSRDYTGAPYYAASSSLKFGGDLAFVFCSKQAAGPIKTYSPELMVVPFYDDEFVDSMKSHNYSSSADEKEVSFLRFVFLVMLNLICSDLHSPGSHRRYAV